MKCFSLSFFSWRKARSSTVLVKCWHYFSLSILMKNTQFSTKLEILQITHMLLNFKLVLYKNANFDRALIWMKVLECLALVWWWWCRKGEISAYTNWGIIVHFAMKRKRYFFNLVPRVFSQHPTTRHACKDLDFFLQEEKLMLGVIQAITSHFQELKKLRRGV